MTAVHQCDLRWVEDSNRLCGSEYGVKIVYSRSETISSYSYPSAHEIGFLLE